MQATIILIVEGELVLRNSVIQALSAAGWNVLDAGSGEAAIALLHASLRPISALFTATQLTGVLTGWDVADAFRKKYPTAPIVYASGNNAARNRQISGSALLEKPYRVTDVVAAFDHDEVGLARHARSRSNF